MAELAGDGDASIEELDEEADKREADAAAAAGTGTGFVSTVEAVEDEGQVLGGDAAAVVTDEEADLAVAGFAGQGDPAALGGVLDGIFDEVGEDLGSEFRVSFDEYGLRGG